MHVYMIYSSLFLIFSKLKRHWMLFADFILIFYDSWIWLPLEKEELDHILLCVSLLVPLESLMPSCKVGWLEISLWCVLNSSRSFSNYFSLYGARGQRFDFVPTYVCNSFTSCYFLTAVFYGWIGCLRSSHLWVEANNKSCFWGLS